MNPAMLGGGLLICAAAAGLQADPGASLDRLLLRAEAHLMRGEGATAEGLYREALFEGWLLVGTLDRLEGRLPESRRSLLAAADLGLEDRPRLQALAVGLLKSGEAARALELLAALAARPPPDFETLRLLAKASAATGQREQALRELEAALQLAAGEPEATFLVATELLWLKEPVAAERLFAQVIAARPQPQTRVLIGRACRDAGEHARAITHLRAALEQDPRVERAHYYLGMVALADPRTGPQRLEQAIAEFREELRLNPGDALTHDQLGLALLDSERPREALPFFEAAVRGAPRAVYVHHLGRCLLALERAGDAAASLQRALDLARTDASAEP